MKANFETIINENEPVLIDFHAEWCGPCKTQSPILKEIATELTGKVKVLKIDVDKNAEIAGRYRIQSVPTIMLFKKGELKFRHSGVMSIPQLVQEIMKSL